MKISKEPFLLAAGSKFNISTNSSIVYNRRFRSIFGVSAQATAIVWNSLDQNSAQYLHLLWALHFLKNYTLQYNGAFIGDVMRRHTGCGFGIL